MEIVPISVGTASRAWDQQNIDLTSAAGLIGDPCQLPEIDAGGAFAGLARRLGSVELTDNRRQREAWERDALAQLRNGDPDKGIDAFVDRDRVHLEPRGLRGVRREDDPGHRSSCV